MFRLFKRGSTGGDAKPSLDAIRFDTTGHEFHAELQPGMLRVWWTPEGDGLGVHFFPFPPELPSGAESVDELAAYYRGLLGDSGGRLVEAVVVEAGGCPALRTVRSVPQQPSGRSYVGALTVPFRDLSFVLKCQCLERGITGVKETMLLERSWSAKQAQGEQPFPPDWDPDAPEHDAEFPDHPVARARRVLDHIQRSLVIADEIRQLPGFALPRGRTA
jgi:hypothetical protein